MYATRVTVRSILARRVVIKEIKDLVTLPFYYRRGDLEINNESGQVGGKSTLLHLFLASFVASLTFARGPPLFSLVAN